MSRWPNELRRADWRHVLHRAWRPRPRHVLLLQPQGVQAWRDDTPTPADEPPADHASFAAWCAAHPGAQARVVVSGHLLRCLVVDPALGLRDEAQVRDYARQQFAHYHGAAAGAWPVAAWCEGAQAGACALSDVDLAALQGDAAAHDVELRSVTPLWSAGLVSLSRRSPAFADAGRHALALVEGPLLTWLEAECGEVVALQQRYLDATHVDALVSRLNELLADRGPWAQPPLVVGWGLDASPTDAVLPWRALTPLTQPAASAAWVQDRMGAAA